MKEFVWFKCYLLTSDDGFVFLIIFSSSWDEHVFELVLPKACMVGHVDFKFVLNPNIVNIPQIQVTLLKNKAPGLGKVSGECGSDVQPKTSINHSCCGLMMLVCWNHVSIWSCLDHQSSSDVFGSQLCISWASSTVIVQKLLLIVMLILEKR